MSEKKVDGIEEKNDDVCDFCGSYWTPSHSDTTTCAICGAGSRVGINSKFNTRKIAREKDVTN
jgi:methionyl-tRNA synthetase